jgi:hypothetical protein
MLSSEQIILQVNKVTAGNLTYITYQPRWKALLDAYLGGAEYRKGKYLTKYQLETAQEYGARLDNTPLENHCQSIVSVYKSFLFRKEPQRDFGSIEGMPELEDFIADADMDGRSLNAFMKDVATWSSVFGHCFILVSKPNVGAVTRAEEQQVGARPYVSLLTPLVVLDWYFKREATGRYTLDYFRYIEEINENIITVKEWNRQVIKTTIVDDDKKEIIESQEEVNGLGEIPVVIAYNQRSTVRGLGVSDLTDIADLQKFIYNATSEAVESLRMDSHPSLVATPETRVGTGAGSLILMPENLDPGLKPYILQNTGANVDMIYKSIQHTVAAIDKIANTGAVRATESRTLSGVAMQVEFELLAAKLSEKADNLELAEEHLFEFWCKYMGTKWNGSIDYPEEFNVKDTGAEIQYLKTASDIQSQDPEVRLGIDARLKKWLEMDTEDALTESSTPEESIQQKIMSGDSDAKIIAEGITPDALLAAKQDLLDVEDQS